MGSVTKYGVTSMSSISMFNLHLDHKDETESERKRRNEESLVLMNMAQGMKNQLGE